MINEVPATLQQIRQIRTRVSEWEDLGVLGDIENVTHTNPHQQAALRARIDHELTMVEWALLEYQGRGHEDV